jgi:hypothetical protein
LAETNRLPCHRPTSASGARQGTRARQALRAFQTPLSVATASVAFLFRSSAIMTVPASVAFVGLVRNDLPVVRVALVGRL